MSDGDGTALVPVTGHGAIRVEAEEYRGPRGGRRTRSRGGCVRCEAATEWREDRTPGSNSAAIVDAVDLDRTSRCLRAPDAAVLWEVARVVRSGARDLPLEVAVLLGSLAEYAGRGIPGAVVRAWSCCDDGAAMGYLAAGAVGMVEGVHPEHEVHVYGLRLGGCIHAVRGPPVAVADALRRLVPDPRTLPCWPRIVALGGG